MNGKPKKVLITGVTGFIGRALCAHLIEEGWEVRGTLLESGPSSSLVRGVELVKMEPFGKDTPWSHALADIGIIIHLAARVHIMSDCAADPLSEFRRVNVEGTTRLAYEAAKFGIRRFVFISSIKVNGEETATPYTADSPANPSDPYGISKWEAEQALRRIEAETGMEVVIIRPTLVYGPGVKANFLNMMRMIQRGIPLPFASIINKRSFIYVGNLVGALTVCAHHPAAAGKTYLVSDGKDISTPELIRRTATVLGATTLLFSVPVSLMHLVGKLMGKSEMVRRLTGSLAVDSSKIRNELGWKPPFTMDDALRDTAGWFNTNWE